MEHSIAAKYAARPPARFPRHAARTRERRLGLRSVAPFSAAPVRLTVLLRPQPGALTRLRADWRSIKPTRQLRSLSGRVRPAARMTWTRSVPTRRPSAPAAPWRA